MADVLDRFLRYINIMTSSDENSENIPTTQCQFELAHMLVQEMKEMGISDASVDEKCYVYGTIPATAGCEKCPALGFIAHMDTVSDFAEHPVKPLIHKNYDGKDLPLGKSGRILSVKKFPHLSKFAGRTLITSDGTTILGADDKAGIAEILTMAEILIQNQIPHGKICIGFTPDEEVGAGADHFDVEKFGADFAYTVDGDTEGGIEYENFNAASAKFEIYGVNVHPGSAKDIMVNASLVAMEIVNMLPETERPEHTEKYEGFYHLTDMDGCVEKAHLSYIIRDHDAEIFENRLEVLRDIEEKINEKYGVGTVKLEIKEQYRNMAEKIRECFHLVETAKLAAKELGTEPVIAPIRGGTDGARLSFMGLPCPNLGTGGHAFHGPYEHITREGMEVEVQILVGIVKKYAL